MKGDDYDNGSNDNDGTMICYDYAVIMAMIIKDINGFQKCCRWSYWWWRKHSLLITRRTSKLHDKNIYLLITKIIIIIIKMTTSPNSICSFNTLLFLNLTAKKSFIGECPITKCCYWTPVIGQLNEPATTWVPGFWLSLVMLTLRIGLHSGPINITNDYGQ